MLTKTSSDQDVMSSQSRKSVVQHIIPKLLFTTIVSLIGSDDHHHHSLVIIIKVLKSECILSLHITSTGALWVKSQSGDRCPRYTISRFSFFFSASGPFNSLVGCSWSPLCTLPFFRSGDNDDVRVDQQGGNPQFLQ